VWLLCHKISPRNYLNKTIWAGQGLLLWNLKAYHRGHKSPPLGPILNQLKPVHYLTLLSLRIILILSTHLCLCCTISWGVGPKCIDFSCFCTSYMLFPSHPTGFNHPNIRLQDFWISWQWRFKLRSSGSWLHTALWQDTKVSEGEDRGSKVL
jgi:hypothetical protein